MLKLKITKATLKRKIEGVTTTGYYGRVKTNGKASFNDIAKESARNTTLHAAEAELAARLLLEGVCDKIKQGFIVDLGPLGKLYPSVSGTWETDPEELKLADMTPKVNYKPSDDIDGAIRGARLQWATVAEEEDDDETPTDEPTDQTPGGDDNPPAGEEGDGNE